MFCRSLFVLLYFFFWLLCCLFFFDIRIMITPLVSINSFCLLFWSIWVRSLLFSGVRIDHLSNHGKCRTCLVFSVVMICLYTIFVSSLPRFAWVFSFAFACLLGFFCMGGGYIFCFFVIVFLCFACSFCSVFMFYVCYLFLIRYIGVSHDFHISWWSCLLTVTRRVSLELSRNYLPFRSTKLFHSNIDSVKALKTQITRLLCHSQCTPLIYIDLCINYFHYFLWLKGLIFKEAVSSIISQEFCFCSSKPLYGFYIRNHLLF
jgi:hypothetical protein